MQTTRLYYALSACVIFVISSCAEIPQTDVPASPSRPKAISTSAYSGFALDNASPADDYRMKYSTPQVEQKAIDTDQAPDIAVSAEEIEPIEVTSEASEVPKIEKNDLMEDQKSEAPSKSKTKQPADFAIKQLNQIFSQPKEQKK